MNLKETVCSYNIWSMIINLKETIVTWVTQQKHNALKSTIKFLLQGLPEQEEVKSSNSLFGNEKDFSDTKIKVAVKSHRGNH